ncbi:hypothetical protein Tco_1481464 [Tanacetum coccineum]
MEEQPAHKLDQDGDTLTSVNEVEKEVTTDHIDEKQVTVEDEKEVTVKDEEKVTGTSSSSKDDYAASLTKYGGASYSGRIRWIVIVGKQKKGLDVA